MIYSVYVLSKEGPLIASRIASRVTRVQPELFLEMASSDRDVAVGLGEHEVLIGVSGDVVYAIVHDGEAKARELMKELKTFRPRTYNDLVKILWNYVAPKRREIENLVAKFASLYKPMEAERIEIKEEEPSREGSILESYNDGYYWEAREYKVDPDKPILAALWTFAARLTRMSPTIRRVPSRKSLMFYASRTPEEVRRYYQGLVEGFTNFSQYLAFAETALKKQRELAEYFRFRKLLFTTIAVPIPGLSRLVYMAVNNVPENRRDFFAARTFAAYLVEGRMENVIITKSLEGLESGRPLAYAYYLPIAIHSSNAMSLGEGDVFGEILADHLRRFDQEPRYSFFSISTLSRSLPVLRVTASSLVEREYERIVQELIQRYVSERLPHLIFGGAAATLALLAASFGENMFSLIAQPEILRSIRVLYRFTAKGSRSAAALMRRLLPAIALGVLAKNPEDKEAKEMLLKSYLTISKYDFIHDLILKAAREVASPEASELLERTYGFR